MKLQNKKNGIVEQCHIDCGYAEDKINFRCYAGTTYDNTSLKTYNSLSELNEEWEDVPEEPKDYWRITWRGYVVKETDDGTPADKDCKEIGNYFETKEEAEKAVEKLKAWKRLKDKGFRFDLLPALGHCDDEKFDISIIATMPAKWWYNDKVIDDIHYVFGGEE